MNKSLIPEILKDAERVPDINSEILPPLLESKRWGKATKVHTLSKKAFASRKKKNRTTKASRKKNR